MGSKFFPSRVDPFCEGMQAASPEGVSIPHKGMRSEIVI